MMEWDVLYNEECLEGMRRHVPDCSVDCVICDLPYGSLNSEWDKTIPFEPLWEEYRRVCKPTATIVLFGSEPFASKLRTSKLGWYRYDWVWLKSRSSDFINAKVRPLKKHEGLLVFTVGGRKDTTYNPQGVRRVDKVRKNGRGKFGPSARKWNHPETYVQEFENYPTSVLRFKNDWPCIHPTQKPVDLIRYLVRTYTNEGEVVLDNCAGSGTTCVACIREKRHWIGFELNKEYFDKARRRIWDEELSQG